MLRAALITLLLGAAYFAARPWISCAFPLGANWYPELWRLCAFGVSPGFDRTGPGPLWSNIVFGAIYLLAALYVARAHFAIDAPGSARRRT